MVTLLSTTTSLKKKKKMKFALYSSLTDEFIDARVELECGFNKVFLYYMFTSSVFLPPSRRSQFPFATKECPKYRYSYHTLAILAILEIQCSIFLNPTIILRLEGVKFCPRSIAATATLLLYLLRYMHTSTTAKLPRYLARYTYHPWISLSRNYRNYFE